MRQSIRTSQVHDYIVSIIGEDLHAKRVLSLVNATIGVIHAATLGVCAIGRALAMVHGLKSKHAIKQVDRLLSNVGFELSQFFSHWIPYVVAARAEIVVALDWTDFDADGHSTLALHMVTSHGRATPLIWKTVRKSRLKGRRNAYEDKLLGQLRLDYPYARKGHSACRSRLRRYQALCLA